jgi:hypothetical protein
MMTDNNMKSNFFQNEKKFVVGKWYETLRVIMPKWGTYPSNLETCDEIGTIIPNSEKFLGKYVSSQCYGYGDNAGRYDYFINEKGETITNYLDYDGKTRYRRVDSFMDKRIHYITLAEAVGNNINENNVNEHINRYLLNSLLLKEICSYIGPDSK